MKIILFFYRKIEIKMIIFISKKLRYFFVESIDNKTILFNRKNIKQYFWKQSKNIYIFVFVEKKENIEYFFWPESIFLKTVKCQVSFIEEVKQQTIGK